MNQKIHLHINSISEKASKLIKKLSELRNENENLAASNKELQLKLAESDKNNENCISQNIKLKELHSTAKSVVDVSPGESSKRNQEIDQIVREIENCIDQLKR